MRNIFLHQRCRTKATRQPHSHYHIAITNYRDYRPASQAVFSVVYMSVTMVSTTFSVASRFTSAALTTHIVANSYHDYKSASQAVFSVVYTSVTTVNLYYFQCGKKIYQRGRIDAYIYPDYRSALQAVFSVIYMLVIVISQYEFSE